MKAVGWLLAIDGYNIFFFLIFFQNMFPLKVHVHIKSWQIILVVKGMNRVRKDTNPKLLIIMCVFLTCGIGLI